MSTEYSYKANGHHVHAATVSKEGRVVVSIIKEGKLSGFVLTENDAQMKDFGEHDGNGGTLCAGDTVIVHEVDDDDGLWRVLVEYDDDTKVSMDPAPLVIAMSVIATAMKDGYKATVEKYVKQD